MCILGSVLVALEAVEVMRTSRRMRFLQRSTGVCAGFWELGDIIAKTWYGNSGNEHFLGVYDQKFEWSLNVVWAFLRSFRHSSGVTIVVMKCVGRCRVFKSFMFGLLQNMYVYHVWELYHSKMSLTHLNSHRCVYQIGLYICQTYTVLKDTYT